MHTNPIGQWATLKFDPWFREGQPAVVYYSGAPADELYPTGVPVAGNIIGAIAGNVLAPVAAPLYRQVLVGDADDPLGVAFHDATIDSFDAVLASTQDYDNVSFSVLCPIRYAVLPFYRSYVGKLWTGAPNRGWAMYARATACYCTFRGPAGSPGVAVPWVPVVGNIFVFFVWVSIPLGLCGLTVINQAGIIVGEATTPYAGCGTLTNLGYFCLGQLFYTANAGCIGPTPIWSAANADLTIATRAAWIPAWITAAMT